MKLKDDKYTQYAKENIIRNIAGEQVRFVHGKDYTIAYIRDEESIYASKVTRSPKFKNNRNVARMYASQKLLSYFKIYDYNNVTSEQHVGILTEETVSGRKVEVVNFNHLETSIIIDVCDLVSRMNNLCGGLEDHFFSQGVIDHMIDLGTLTVRSFKHSFISHVIDCILSPEYKLYNS